MMGLNAPRCLRWFLAVTFSVTAVESFAQSYTSFFKNGQLAGLPTAEAPKTANEAIGEAVWFMAAPNSRFHTYSLPQRVGAGMNFWEMFRSDRKYDQDGHLGRWKLFGSINDPDCCAPGRDCTAKIAAATSNAISNAQAWREEAAWIRSNAADKNYLSSTINTFGFDYCIGDARMYQGYANGRWDGQWEDPACDSRFALISSNEATRCSLAFGQPTGVVGFRKEPNPRFNEAKWREQEGWAGWQANIRDGSLEPPFRISMACTSCHVTHNPVNAAINPENPDWPNLLGAFGAQHARTSEIHSSAIKAAMDEEPGVFAAETVMRELFRTRPGITDTSAVPHDFTYNPGSFLAVINFDQKPTHVENVSTRAQTNTNPDPGAQDGSVRLHRILKGGEDSTGARDAVHRVYINIGMCAEQCWLNHLTDLGAIHPHARGYGQTPFNANQCFQDCAAFGAVGNATKYVVDFLLTRRPVDLEYVAADPETPTTTIAEVKNEQNVPDVISQETKGLLRTAVESNQGQRALRIKDSQGRSKTLSELMAELNRDWYPQIASGFSGDTGFAAGDVETGARVFAQNCASCHSTQTGAASTRPEKYWETVDESTSRAPHNYKVRKDWLGNDELTPAAAVGTFKCRSLHSNHLPGHVWEYYGSQDHQSQRATAVNNPQEGGSYRNISLLSVWATAPLLHNNSVGPEICGERGHPEDLYRNAYRATGAPGCWEYDISPAGRIKLYLASMDELLNPVLRASKVAQTDNAVEIPLPIYVSGNQLLTGTNFADNAIVRLWELFNSRQMQQVKLGIPAGTSAALLGNANYKELLGDIVRYYKSCGSTNSCRSEAILNQEARTIIPQVVNALRARPTVLLTFQQNESQRAVVRGLIRAYNTCKEEVENQGHTFGAALSPVEKRGLKAFLLTL